MLIVVAGNRPAALQAVYTRTLQVRTSTADYALASSLRSVEISRLTMSWRSRKSFWSAVKVADTSPAIHVIRDYCFELPLAAGDAAAGFEVSWSSVDWQANRRFVALLKR